LQEVKTSSEAAEPTKAKPEKEPQDDTDKSDTAILSAAAADRLVEAAWKKPAVEREWLANREREKGNELFKVGLCAAVGFDKIEQYTESSAVLLEVGMLDDRRVEP
jgi:hypothetical protein